MVLLLFYCGLLSTVVSAHFNNNASHDGDELDMNTTLSTLPSTTISVSKDCVLEMKENEISEVTELFNSNFVNVVVIHISLANGSHEGELLSDFNFNVLLSNPIGREILYALEKWEFWYFPWTLKAGIRNFKLSVKGSQYDCIKTGKNPKDFVLESTQHIVDSVNLAINYHVCSSFKETSSGKVNLTCCHMAKHNLATEFNYKCPKGSSFLFESDLLWWFIFYMITIFGLFYLMLLLLVFLSRTEFNFEYPEYHKLEESMMSPSTILLKVIWDENGRVASFIRSLVLVGVFSYFWYLMLWTEKQNKNVSITFTPLFVAWGLSFSVSNLFRFKIPNSSENQKRIEKQRNNFFVNALVIHWEKGKREYFENVVKIIMQPFNPKVWKPMIKNLYNDCKAFVTWKTRRFRNRTLKTLALCFYSVLALLICFVCISILFCLLTSVSIFYPILLFVILLIGIYRSKYRDDNFSQILLSSIDMFGLCYLFLQSILMISYTIVSFLLGLFLNLFHFIPFIAFFSVLTFYCSTYWKTMEEKYFVLKQLIYEACRETQNINNIPNRHPKPGEKVLLVVSSKLHDKIREEFLPYDTNLFYFVLKIFWVIAFSLGIFALIKMLNEFNVTGLVQVVTTASLGVMPHIFNMVGSKTSEAKTKAHNENLKLNVKYMAQELIRENPELARTVLIMEQDLDDYKRSANPLFLRILRYPFYRCRPDNNYAEDCEQGSLLSLQEINTTTNDENTENSEHFETMFGISFSGNDDVEDIEPGRTRTVRRNNETTTDDNGQNSENAHARFEANSNNDDFEDDEPYPTVIVHRNNESTTVENVHTGPESNPDNTDHMEDNGLSPTVMVDTNNETITVENVHTRPESNPDNTDDIEDNELTPTVMVHRNNESTTVENVHTGPESNPDNTDHIEDNGLSPTLMVDGSHETKTVENVHSGPESNHDNTDIEDNGLFPTVTVNENNETITVANVHTGPELNHYNTDDIEDNVLSPTVMADGNNETITVENVHAGPESNHDNTNIEDNGLSQIVMVDRNHETTTDENVHARPESNPDNTDHIEDNGLPQIVMVDRNHETATDENVHARPESSPNNTDAIEDNGLSPTVIVDWNHERRSYENFESSYSSFESIPDYDVKDYEQAPIVVANRNDAKNDENSQTVYALPDLNPNDDTQALTMLTIQQDDVEDDELGKDDDATSNNTSVVEENIQNESNV